MEINALSPLLCLVTEIYISNAFFHLSIILKLLKKVLKLKVAFERKESYVEHKNFVVLNIIKYHRGASAFFKVNNVHNALLIAVYVHLVCSNG